MSWNRKLPRFFLLNTNVNSIRNSYLIENKKLVYGKRLVLKLRKIWLVCMTFL